MGAGSIHVFPPIKPGDPGWRTNLPFADRGVLLGLVFKNMAEVLADTGRGKRSSKRPSTGTKIVCELDGLAECRALSTPATKPEAIEQLCVWASEFAAEAKDAIRAASAPIGGPRPRAVFPEQGGQRATASSASKTARR